MFSIAQPLPFQSYVLPRAIVPAMAVANICSTPVKFNSGIFANRKNTRTLLSRLEVTAWCWNRKAAPLLNTGASRLSLRYVE